LGEKCSSTADDECNNLGEQMLYTTAAGVPRCHNFPLLHYIEGYPPVKYTVEKLYLHYFHVLVASPEIFTERVTTHSR
jgi:hypothetical protein